jgi:tRNA(Arg) A34 adenosine deaminase TadA
MVCIRRTIDLARANVEEGGRPFACVIVEDGKIVAEAINRVAQTHDPTAHAEIETIRLAAAKSSPRPSPGASSTSSHTCAPCVWLPCSHARSTRCHIIRGGRPRSEK